MEGRRGRLHAPARSTPLTQHRADLVLLLVTLIIGATTRLSTPSYGCYPPLSLTTLFFGSRPRHGPTALAPASARVPT